MIQSIFKKLRGISPYLLGVEFLLLCVALPTVIIVYKFAPFMFFFLWSACGYCFLVYAIAYRDELKDIWRWRAVTWDAMKPILKRWVICCVLMTVFIWLYDPDRMFGLLREKPHIIPFLLIMYPVLSALPQEFIFCTFFFRRYRAFFKSQTSMIIASAIVFAYAHVLFINPVAPVLSLVAGIIFARTYAQTQSLALVTIEHGLYGNFLFVVGLGWYFWGGAVAEHQASF
jgi:hypothetical protein